MSTDETIVEQIPANVLDFSSQYGSNNSRSYTIENICSHPEIYPNYGDSTNALVFRTYGPWWLNLPSYQSSKRSFLRRTEEFTSRDFIEIEYGNPISQCISLDIYETYNPGSLEIVYAGEEKENGCIIWHQVWKFPEPFSIILTNGEEIQIRDGRQQMNDLFPDHINTATSALHSLQLNTDHQLVSKIHTRHSYPPAARFSRILKIPLENKITFPTRHMRLEFDHCTANYYIEIDTIKLCGRPSSGNSSTSTANKILNKSENTTSINFTKLPFDLLFLICSYLDLRSLIRLSSTCRFLREQCLHSLQFLALDLQPYWNGISNQSIEQFFLEHCRQTRYLSLAWTKAIDSNPFNQLLNTCATNLLQLNLACCQYLNGEYIQAIVSCCPNIEMINLESCMNLARDDFIPLINLHQIRSLNVYRTRIDYKTLLPLINNNKEHLENINLASCQSLIDTGGIVKLLFGRCKNLRSVDLWRARYLTPYDYLSLIGQSIDPEIEALRLSNSIPIDEQEDLGLIYSLVEMPFEIHSLNHLKCLSEIDLGWTNIPGGFIKALVQQAGYSLIKIFLTACRHISNEDIFAISTNCPYLRQLDILGSNVIIEEAIESILKHCPQMEFLDLSFCSRISPGTISLWKSKYQNCFKQSYQPLSHDDVYHEFPEKKSRTP